MKTQINNNNTRNTKIISVEIPEGVDIPICLSSFSVEETMIMLKVGCYAVETMKQKMCELYSDEDAKRAMTEYYSVLMTEKDNKVQELQILNNVIKEELSVEYEKRFELEMKKIKSLFEEQQYKLCAELTEVKNRNMRLEKEAIKMEETKKYIEMDLEGKVNMKVCEYKDKIRELTEQITTEKMNREMEKNKELSVVISEFTERMEELKQQNNKSNLRGKAGEDFVSQLLCETFEDFTNFEIINTSKQAHSGDFHLKFDEFTVLVDSKFFVDSKGVKSTDRNKLKVDMKHNQHIKIAWMISVDKPIQKYKDAPFMMSIEDGVCYCYINSLGQNSDPHGLLRSCWCSSREIFRTILNCESEVSLLDKYKKQDIRVKCIAETLLKELKESYLMVNQFRDNLERQEKNVREILSGEILSIREMHTEIVKTWWNENVCGAEGAATKKTGAGAGAVSVPASLKTNALYEEFTKTHDKRIDIDTFKQILKTILKEHEYSVGKTERAQYTIHGYVLRNKL